MKLLLKILLGVVALVVIVIIAAMIYINSFLPDVKEAPVLTINPTPEMFERGKYLANHVAVCIDCHSERDWNFYSGPVKHGTEGKGGEKFDEKMGFPGTFYAKNITPAGIGGWTDGEIYRTITAGVDRDGEPLFPVMPFRYYSQMDPEDIKAIIAYIRTLNPIENEVPESEPSFPMNFIMRTLPQDVESSEKPSESNEIAYGKYLTNIAGCIECHTPQVKGEQIKELTLAGGFKFDLGKQVVFSANITPDEETGIGSWGEDDFVETFKSYLETKYINEKGDSVEPYQVLRKIKMEENDLTSVMPWTMYAGMKESDLRSIYKYLRTVEPIKHEVEQRYIK